jgi:hypothetical protein
MLNLEALIARFVADVLRAIRGATLEELRDLSTASPRKSSAAPRSSVRRRARRRPPVGISTASQSRSVSDRVDVASVGEIREPPVAADITDPERLLVTTPSARPEPSLAPNGEAGAPAGLLEEPPSRHELPVVGSSVSLRPGETLASASTAGVVIRRSKKA